jgi:hypothetical protein
VLFAVLTGKGLELNSGVLLVLVVVLTTLHATRDILRRSNLPQWLRLVGTPAVVLAAIGTYAVAFNAISAVMKDVPMTTAPTELTVVHVAVGALFVAAYAVSALEWHRHSERLYVALLNLAQPDPVRDFPEGGNPPAAACLEGLRDALDLDDHPRAGVGRPDRGSISTHDRLLPRARSGSMHVTLQTAGARDDASIGEPRPPS